VVAPGVGRRGGPQGPGRASTARLSP